MKDKSISSWGQLVTLTPDAGAGEAPTEERRAWVRYVCDLVTVYQPTQQQESERLLARVRNISRGGINLVVDKEFTSGSILSVEVPAEDGNPLCSLLACVIHATQQAGGDWALGCSFVRELSDDDLEPYGAKRVRAGAADQRTWTRFVCNVQATYRIVRMTERQPTPAEVIDISPCGVGLRVKRSIPPGTVLGVDLQNPDARSKLRIFACVVRVKEVTAGEYAMGCNFIREISNEEMKGLLPSERQN
jgi:c-di-GMP-binding flagellar brake protein YcgR